MFRALSTVLALSTLTSLASAALVHPSQYIAIAYPKKVLSGTQFNVSFAENDDLKFYPGLQYNVSLSITDPDGDVIQSNMPAGPATVTEFSETGCLSRPGKGYIQGLELDTLGNYTMTWTFTYAYPSDASTESSTSCGSGPFSTEVVNLPFIVQAVDNKPTKWASTLAVLPSVPTGMVKDVDSKTYIEASGTAGAANRPDSMNVPGKGPKSIFSGAASTGASLGMMAIPLIVAALF